MSEQLQNLNKRLQSVHKQFLDRSVQPNLPLSDICRGRPTLYKSRVLLHFSPHAEKILSEGFRIGEPEIERLACSWDDSRVRQRRDKVPGFNCAFDAELPPEQIIDAAGNILGIWKEPAVVFTAPSVQVCYLGNFDQNIFWGEDADLRGAVLIQALEEEDPWYEKSEVDQDYNAYGDYVPLFRRLDTGEVDALGALLEKVGAEITATQAAAAPSP